MATATAESFIASQREVLNTKRTETQKRLAEVQSELDDLDRELRAIEAYEEARNGKSHKHTAPRKSTARSKRDQLLALIKDSGGLTRADVIDKMGAQGDKSAEQSISNALSNLKKQSKLTQDDDGKYIAA